MTGVRFTRRAAGAIAFASASALLLAGCGTSSATSGAGELSDEPVTITMTWWGNDIRQAATQSVIDSFEKEHPNITVEPSYSDWAGYWDKLATETAANNTPDIIQMDEKYISTYASRGALLDLGTLGDALPTDDIEEAALDTGKVDGTLYGITTGLTAYSLIANPTLFEQAGVEMPDDKTWTWDDFEKTAAALSAAGAGAFYGTQSWGFEDGGLRLWARQHGDQLYNEKGEVVIKEETVADFWTFVKKLTDEGSAPPASGTIEKQAAGLSESYTATNQAALGTWWNSQLTALAQASGEPLTILRLPETADGGYWYKPSMFWSASSRTEHPAEVALFLDYLVNSEEAGDAILTDRGVPSNTKVREHITPKLAETDQEVVAFLDDLKDSVGEAEVVTPNGGSAIEALLKQYTEQVLFGQATPEEAAKGFVADLTAEVENAA